MSPLRPLDLNGIVLSLLLAALWGGNPVAIKVGLADAPPLRLAAMRFLLGGVVILAFAVWTRRSGLFTLRAEERRAVWSLGLLLAVQVGLANFGINLTSAAHGTVLVNSYAVHTVVLAHFFIPGDRLTAAKLGGVLIAYAGIVLLFTGGLSFGGGTLFGDIVVVVSAFLLGERTVYMARALQRVDPLKLLIGQSAIGSAGLFLASFWLESEVPTHYTPVLLASLAYQGIVIAGFNFVVNAWMLQRYRPSALAAWALTAPVLGVLIAAAVVGDALTPTLLAASVMVAAGIGLATRK